MPPSELNFKAFESRLSNTCSIRSASAMTPTRCAGASSNNCTCLASARSWTLLTDMSVMRLRSVGTIRYSIIPASILDRSRIVEMSVMSRRLLSAMMRKVVRCSCVRGPGISSSSRCVPSWIEAIGVRNSWETCARNSPFISSSSCSFAPIQFTASTRSLSSLGARIFRDVRKSPCPICLMWVCN